MNVCTNINTKHKNGITHYILHIHIYIYTAALQYLYRSPVECRSIYQRATNPKGPCTQIVYTFGPMYLYMEYFKAKVYTFCVHGPSRAS